MLAKDTRARSRQDKHEVEEDDVFVNVVSCRGEGALWLLRAGALETH